MNNEKRTAQIVSEKDAVAAMDRRLLQHRSESSPVMALSMLQLPQSVVLLRIIGDRVAVFDSVASLAKFLRDTATRFEEIAKRAAEEGAKK